MVSYEFTKGYRLSCSVKIDPMYGVFQSNSFHLDVCKNNMVPEKDYGLGVFPVNSKRTGTLTQYNSPYNTMKPS